MKSYYFVLFYIIPVLLYNCGVKSAEELIKFYHKAPYIQHWEGKSIKINAMLVTPKYERLQQIIRYGKKNEKIKQKYIDSLMECKSEFSGVSFKLFIEPTEKYSDTLFFHNSDILLGFKRTKEQREEAIKEYNFGLSTKIWIEINDVKIRPSLCHLERNFGMDNSRNIWINFKLDENLKIIIRNQKKIKLYFDNPLSGEGVAIFSWSGKIFKTLI